MDQQKQVFTIQQLSMKLNISKPTLRFWEKELAGIIVPFRTCGKQRRYNLEDLTIIEKVKELREKGMSLSEIKYKFGNSKKTQDNNSDSDTIDLLADHIAEIVKAEVCRFFE